MPNHAGLFLLGSLLLSGPVFSNPAPGKELLKGWLSDSSCAKNRAAGGLFTATNAVCAKECVTKGERIVLIDPDHKKVIDIQNQDTVKNNVSDYVELTGTLNSQNVLVVESVKFLDKNRAMCGVPEKKTASKN